MASFAMTRCAWWEISVSVPADAADAVAGIMEAVFAAAPVQCQRAGSSVTKVTVYLPKSARPDSSLIKSLKERISALAVGEAARCLRRIRVSRLKPENWRDSWKKHFRPIEFGGVLLIKPTWSHRKAKPGQTVVVLNPGLAFGTGHHATTAYCLDEIVRFRCGGQPAAFLDVGTGSGILYCEIDHICEDFQTASWLKFVSICFSLAASSAVTTVRPLEYNVAESAQTFCTVS
jgi:ribosomal protein L11 methyltransferase